MSLTILKISWTEELTAIAPFSEELINLYISLYALTAFTAFAA